MEVKQFNAEQIQCSGHTHWYQLWTGNKLLTCRTSWWSGCFFHSVTISVRCLSLQFSDGVMTYWTMCAVILTPSEQNHRTQWWESKLWPNTFNKLYCDEINQITLLDWELSAFWNTVLIVNKILLIEVSHSLNPIECSRFSNSNMTLWPQHVAGFT